MKICFLVFLLFFVGIYGDISPYSLTGVSQSSGGESWSYPELTFPCDASSTSRGTFPTLNGTGCLGYPCSGNNLTLSFSQVTPFGGNGVVSSFSLNLTLEVSQNVSNDISIGVLVSLGSVESNQELLTFSGAQNASRNNYIISSVNPLWGLSSLNTTNQFPSTMNFTILVTFQATETYLAVICGELNVIYQLSAVTTSFQTTGVNTNSSQSTAQDVNSATTAAVVASSMPPVEGIVVAVIIGAFFFGVLLVLLIGTLVYRRKYGAEPYELDSIRGSIQPQPVQQMSRSNSFRNSESSRPSSRSSSFMKSSKDHLLERDEEEKYTVKGETSAFISYSKIEFQKSSLVGKGTFGSVYKGKFNGHEVAVKEIKGELVNDKEVEQLVNQSETLKALPSHPNVLPVLAFCASPFSVVTEFVEEGNLNSYLKKHQEVEFKQKMLWMNQICSGMVHLAKHKIIHRSLCTRNCLLNSNLGVQLTDYAIARVVDSHNPSYRLSSLAPLKWTSVEVLKSRDAYSEKSDVWSFGITCVEIITHSDPFPNKEASEVANQVVGGLRPTLPEVDSKLKEGIESCWKENPADRPTFQQLEETVFH